MRCETLIGWYQQLENWLYTHLCSDCLTALWEKVVFPTQCVFPLLCTRLCQWCAVGFSGRENIEKNANFWNGQDGGKKLKMCYVVRVEIIGISLILTKPPSLLLTQIYPCVWSPWDAHLSGIYMYRECFSRWMEKSKLIKYPLSSRLGWTWLMLPHYHCWWRWRLIDRLPCLRFNIPSLMFIYCAKLSELKDNIVCLVRKWFGLNTHTTRDIIFQSKQENGFGVPNV